MHFLKFMSLMINPSSRRFCHFRRRMTKPFRERRDPVERTLAECIGPSNSHVCDQPQFLFLDSPYI